jgi:hypothetical protein
VKNNKVIVLIILILIFVLAACGGGEATTIEESTTGEDAVAQNDNTEVAEEAEAKPEEETAVTLADEVHVETGGFVFQPPAEFEVSVSEVFAEVTDPNDSDTLINLIGFPLEGMSLAEMYDMLTAEFGNDDTITLGEKEDITVNDLNGFSATISGDEDGKSMKGKVVAIGNDTQGVFVLVGAEESKWDGGLADQTDAVINSISLTEIVMPELMETGVEEPIIDEVEEADAEEVEEEVVVEADAASDFDTVFPITDDATNITGEGGESDLIYQTGLTLEEALEFYREELTAQELTERDLLTVVDESVFSIVFDGYENGMAIVIQGVDLGDMTNISIRFEDS